MKDGQAWSGRDPVIGVGSGRPTERLGNSSEEMRAVEGTVVGRKRFLPC